MSESQKLQDQITLDVCGGCNYLDDDLECTRQESVNFPNCYEPFRRSKESET